MSQKQEIQLEFSAMTAPPIVAAAGAATCINLDADKLDGQNGAYYTDASNLNAGLVPTARLGTGTASASKYLRGDQTWAAVPTAQILIKDLFTDGASIGVGSGDRATLYGYKVTHNLGHLNYTVLYNDDRDRDSIYQQGIVGPGEPSISFPNVYYIDLAVNDFTFWFDADITDSSAVPTVLASNDFRIFLLVAA
jgi:hypothetical protein